jgi:hypothetical protein
VSWLRFEPGTSRKEVRRAVRLQRLALHVSVFTVYMMGRESRGPLQTWRAGLLHVGETTKWMLDSDGVGGGG